MATFPKPASAKMFLLMIEVLPQREGVDLPRVMSRLDVLLDDYPKATNVLYKLKVSGESKILSVVHATNVIGLERSIAGIWRLGCFKVDCIPIIPYENFARSIKVSEQLTKTSPNTLSKEGLYWMEFDINHDGKSTKELLDIWKNEAETILNARHTDGTCIELYKVVAQRKVHVFINAENPEQIDLLSRNLPLMTENGANVRIVCKAMQFLDDFGVRFSAEIN